MRAALANILRLIFQIPFFRSRYHGIYKRFIKPWGLLKGVQKTILFQGHLKLVLDVEDWIQQNLYFFDTYEDAERKFLTRSLPIGGVFIDVGSNIGLHALTAADMVGEKGKVIAFEPFSTNFEKLKIHLRLNHQFQICAEKIALSDGIQSLTLKYDAREKNLGMASAHQEKYTHSETVPCTSLDLYLQEKQLGQIDAIKLDIEGNELKALRGMKESLKRYKPKLLVEILDAKVGQLPKADPVSLFLSELGYQVFFVCQDGCISSQFDGRYSRNFAFVHPEQARPC